VDLLRRRERAPDESALQPRKDRCQLGNLPTDGPQPGEATDDNGPMLLPRAEEAQGNCRRKWGGGHN